MSLTASILVPSVAHVYMYIYIYIYVYIYLYIYGLRECTLDAQRQVSHSDPYTGPKPRFVLFQNVWRL